MGRPANFMTSTVDDFHSVDIAWIRRMGGRNSGHSALISWSRAGSEIGCVRYKVERNGIRLSYRVMQGAGHVRGVSHAAEVDELIPIITSPMFLGGRRHWFKCLACGRRCRILYGGERFRCRVCCGARYQSQYQHPALTTIERRWRIRERLELRGGKPWLLGLDAFPPKPPRMHFNTYRRLEVLDEALERLWYVDASGEMLSRG